MCGPWSCLILNSCCNILAVVLNASFKMDAQYPRWHAVSLRMNSCGATNRMHAVQILSTLPARQGNVSAGGSLPCSVAA